MITSISIVDRVRVGGLPVDAVTLEQALAVIARMIDQGTGGTVYTPNADHVVLASQSNALLAAYAEVDLSLADGMPVVWASRLLGTPVPAKVSGSDLVPPLLTLAEAMGWKVYLLGGAPRTAESALQRLRREHPHLRIVGSASPHLDPEDPFGWWEAVTAARAAAPDLVLVALGAPKQELWIHDAAKALRPAVLVGVGATLDFIAGTVRRAPRWMSAAGLEWAYRLAHEPRRLWRRYLVRDPRFVGIVARQMARRRAQRRSGAPGGAALS